MKIKLFVALEIQYFELRIFSFNSYVYYLTRGFIASTRAFNLLTRAFNLPTRTFNLATRAFSLLNCEFELVALGFELVTRGFGLVTRGFELATYGFELVTRNSCFTFPQNKRKRIFNCLTYLFPLSLTFSVFFGVLLILFISITSMMKGYFL